MGVLDGQAVSAGVTNPAFINKNQDDIMPNKLGFTRVLSGTSIVDIQKAINTLWTATGGTENTPGTAYGGPANTVDDGDSYQTAIGKLAQKFSASAPPGHTHSGVDGDGPLIPSSSVDFSALGVGGVVYVDSDNKLKDVPSDFFWDEDNLRLGLRTDAPGATLDIHGDFACSVSDVAATSDIITLDTADKSSIRLTGTGTLLRGIANGSDGKFLTIFNAMSSDLILKDQDGAAAASDQIYTSDGNDLTIVPNQALMLQYEPTPQKWVILAGGGGGSGSYYAGEELLASDLLSKAVTFSASFPTTDYAVLAQMKNLVDSNPQFQPIVITSKSVSGFTASWNAETDSGNYVLEWAAFLNK